MTEHPIPTVSALEPGAHQQPNSQPEAAAQPQPQTQNVMLEAALYYGARGWPVFQLHGMTAVGGCTCGHPHKKEKDKAKHPVKTGGYHNGTTDPVIIKRWFRSGRYNIGIATGPKSNLLIVDVDGPKGEEHLRKLQERYGALPVTLKNLTGRGYHLLFQYPENSGIGSWSRKDLGVDCRGNDGYIVAPPSSHFSGAVYGWDDISVPIAEAPSWLIEFCQTDGESYIKRGTIKDDVMSDTASLLGTTIPPHVHGLGSFDLGATKAPLTPPAWTEEGEKELRDALSKIPASGNENWFDVACGLKWLSALWGDEKCWSILDDWSQANKDEYDPAKNLSRWNSLSADHDDPKTLGTIFKLAEKYGWQSSRSSSTSANNQTGSGSAGTEKDDELNQKIKLIQIAMKAQLWKDPDDNAYATVDCSGHSENYAIKSRGFRRWLTGAYGELHPARIGGQNVPTAPSAHLLTIFLVQLI